MAVINNIREIRTARNLHQEDLAKEIGSCSRTISRIERGVCNPSLEVAIRIAQYLDVPVEEIFHVE